MILKYPENICMLCIPMVMHKNPSDKSIYGSLSIRTDGLYKIKSGSE
ncbi:hypothetical protein JCP62_00265 [Enterococcus faecium]|nr:hypothetical protein [Enterococcus faecium]QQF96171.1 hypothetical protein JCP62_00265 [Enterococcus faecium]